MNPKFQILLTGVGSYLPKKKISNYDLEKFMDTSDEWIRKRTGIKFRHFVEDLKKKLSITTKHLI